MSENDVNKNRRVHPENLFSEELELVVPKNDCSPAMVLSENNERLETTSQNPSTEEGKLFTEDELSDKTNLSLVKDVMENIVNRLENTFSALDTRSQDSICDGYEKESVHLNLHDSDSEILSQEEENAVCDDVKIDGLSDLSTNQQQEKETDDMVVADKEMTEESELNIDKVSTESESWALTYNFSSDPIAITGAWTDFKNVSSNFTKGCKWY